MIVRKLRAQRNWSQEQLADFSGLNVRTIQRVESGQKASIETLKCIASVFEVEISTLTEEFIVIDKESDVWKSEPFWLKLGVIGIKKRSHLVFIEYLLILTGFVAWYLDPSGIGTPAVFFFAYLNAKLLAYVDKKSYW